MTIRPAEPVLPQRRSLRLRGYDYAQAGAYFVTICTQNRVCLFGDVVAGKMRLNDSGRLVAQCWQDIPSRFPNAALDEFVVMPNHLHGIIVIVGAQFIAPHDRGAMNAGAMDSGAMGSGVINRAPTGGNGASDVGAQFIAPHDRGAMNAGAMGSGAINHAPTGGNVASDVRAQFIAPVGAINRAPTVGNGASNVGAQFIAPVGAINRAPTVGDMVRAFKAVATRMLRQAQYPSFAWQRNYYERIIRSEDDLARIREYIANNPLQWALDRENPLSSSQAG
jgi:putative transposase